jgi:hypothetical protein
LHSAERNHTDISEQKSKPFSKSHISGLVPGGVNSCGRHAATDCRDSADPQSTHLLPSRLTHFLHHSSNKGRIAWSEIVVAARVCDCAPLPQRMTVESVSSAPVESSTMRICPRTKRRDSTSSASPIGIVSRPSVLPKTTESPNLRHGRRIARSAAARDR